MEDQGGEKAYTTAVARGCSQCIVGEQELETAVNGQRKFLFARQPDV